MALHEGMFRLALALTALLLCACPQKKPPPPPPDSGRCEVDLAAAGLFSVTGSGASATQISSKDQLIGGEMANGQLGDYLLQNDLIRVIVQAPKRVLGPNPYGGVIIDADLKRPSGEAGHDQMGKLSLLYQFGRIINATKVEVLNDGSSGGYAVLAATGDDAVNDFLNVPRVVGNYVPGAALAYDPNAPLPLHSTTYYVISPGEARVRILTAFCNTGHENTVMAMGDLFEQGGSTDFFNPTGCTNGLGLDKSCTIDPFPWFGFQGDGVAYGLRNYKFTDPTRVETSNVMIPFSGVIGTIAGVPDEQGLLQWFDTSATNRPGAFGVIAGQSRNYVRDFFVGSDLAAITSQFLGLDNQPRRRLNVTVKNPDGSPAAGARVGVVLSSDGTEKTLMVADANGKAKADLTPANYTLKVGLQGHEIVMPVDITVPGTTDVSQDVTLGATHTLSVTIQDPNGGKLSGKVTVLCPGGACANASLAYRPFQDVDPLPSNVQALGFADGTGVANVALPPGVYEVLVSRGPEYSGWPDTFPDMGQMVDLTQGDQAVTATLAHVVDTTGYVSADLHVHAVNSADSSVPNHTRVLSFAAEGVDVLVSTDHDQITDFAPFVADLGLQSQMATMIGCEVSPFDYGHQQAYPVVRSDTPNGGAFDWAGGDGPTLRLGQLYDGLRATFPGVVTQMNHPRGSMGSLTQLKVDTATGASHELPSAFRMDPAPDATADDTKIFSHNFDVIEVMNGPSANLSVMNDWMTFLSTGHVKAATGVSDSHYAHQVTGGYGRTWVKVGYDDAASFTSASFATALKAQHAVAGNGPFIKVTAQKVDMGGTPGGPLAGPGDTLSVDPTAGEKVQLVVDVQAPEWLTFDTIEVYTHALGREATNGVSNDTWPSGRVLSTAMPPLDPTMLTVEPVPGVANARRIHETRTFTLTPSGDTWYVVFVRGSTAAKKLFPLAFHQVNCNSSGACTTDDQYAWSFSNAILIDGDKSGAYDHFPMSGQPLSAPIPQPKAAPYHAMTQAELDAMLQNVFGRE
jgi:hypothetical protein